MKNRRNKPSWRIWAETAITGALVVVLVSVCGWTLMTWPDPQPAPKLDVTTLRLHVKDLAQRTYIINNDLDKRRGK